MVIVGIVLVLVAVATGIVVASGSTPGSDIVVSNFNVSATSAVVFFAGAVAAAVLIAGLWLLAVGARRARERRREVKQLRKIAIDGSSAGSGSSVTTSAGAGSTAAESRDHPERDAVGQDRTARDYPAEANASPDYPARPEGGDYAEQDHGDHTRSLPSQGRDSAVDERADGPR